MYLGDEVCVREPHPAPETMISKIYISLCTTSPDLRHQSFSQRWWHERASETERKLQRQVGLGLRYRRSGMAEAALCFHNNGEPLQWRLLSAEDLQGQFLPHCEPSEQIVFRSELRLNILGRKTTHLRLIWWEMELPKKSWKKKKKASCLVIIFEDGVFVFVCAWANNFYLYICCNAF